MRITGLKGTNRDQKSQEAERSFYAGRQEPERIFSGSLAESCRPSYVFCNGLRGQHLQDTSPGQH